VQLTASGANTYSWSPTEGLDNPSISSPLATPLVTTNYTVTAKDSLGCSTTGIVLVEVMEAGFIPTLFTPNGDGKNDALKIFGLTSASNFRFTIYNREGSVMFDTSDLLTAEQQGWPGVTNGQSQPNGTYFWKVEGDSPGGPVTLNGKKSGAFLLVR
jgi:gliding motility-associated-like protein